MTNTLIRTVQLAIIAGLGFAPTATAKDGINDFKVRPTSGTPRALVDLIAMYKYDSPPADPQAACNNPNVARHMFTWTWLGGTTVTAVGAFSPPQWGNRTHEKYILLCNFDPNNKGYDLSRYEVEMKNCHFYICDTHFRVHRLKRDNLFPTYIIDVGVEGLAKIEFRDSAGEVIKCYRDDCTSLLDSFNKAQHH